MERIVILGAAESGVGAAILAKKQGFDVFVSDGGSIQPAYQALLDTYGVAYESGGHTAELILNAHEVIKSPGIPDTAPMVAAVRSAGISVISEIEFAGRYTTARMIGITGSNGKTTTTSLIYHILKQAGYNVGLAGNIGRSLALQLAEGATFDTYVLELSSFQLDDMFAFRCHVAVLLNITPDHLDRYAYQMQRYIDSKLRILRNQQPEDTFVYWHEDPITTAELSRYIPVATHQSFTELSQPAATAYVADGSLTLVDGYTISLTDISIKGKHNVRNAAAAALAARAVGVSSAALTQGLRTFQAVEHRLEPVGTFGGVHYINDSKATNVDACYYALDAMTTPTILILGGLDKGNDYDAIRDLVIQKCRGVVFLGVDNSKLEAYFRPLNLPMRSTHSMAACIAACRDLAHEGDTVLLSPCCASFDLFTGMADRGRQFKMLAAQL